MAAGTRRASSAEVASKPKHGQQRVRVAQVAQGHQGGGMRHNQARVVESDEGDEQAHARRHRRIQLERNGRYNQLPDADRRQDQEGHPGDKHRAQGRLPGNPHALDHGVSEVGVQPHAGRQRDRIARQDAHHEAAWGGAVRRRRAGLRGPRRLRACPTAADGMSKRSGFSTVRGSSKSCPTGKLCGIGQFCPCWRWAISMARRVAHAPACRVGTLADPGELSSPSEAKAPRQAKPPAPPKGQTPEAGFQPAAARIGWVWPPQRRNAVACG
jgi:hypothetical protein